MAALFAVPSCAIALDSTASAQPDSPASLLLTRALAEIRALRAALVEQASGSQTVLLWPPPEALLPLVA